MNKSSELVSHQEYVGTVATDDPDAHGLMLRLRTLPAYVNWTQVDDAFAGKKKQNNGESCEPLQKLLAFHCIFLYYLKKNKKLVVSLEKDVFCSTSC